MNTKIISLKEMRTAKEARSNHAQSGNYHDESPPEPNWEALAAALLNAQRWWENVESDDDIERRAVRTEAIRIALAVLDTELAGEDDNTMVRTLFENVNRAAFWLSPYFDDPWIKSFCIDPKRAVEMGDTDRYNSR